MSKRAKLRPSPKSKVKQDLAQHNQPLWSIIVSATILVLGLYRAITLRWISDDAFITMRYVKNFVAGHGLVYNVGERVEGYTHFLWLLLLAASQALGFDPVFSSVWLGIFAYAGTLSLLLSASYKEHLKGHSRIWIPLGAVVFVLNYDTAVWASGGLETSLYTFCLFGAFYVWFYSDLRPSRRLLIVGSLLFLTTLLRPDGILFLLTAVLLHVVQGWRGKVPNVTLMKINWPLLLPSVVVGIPYLLWKYYYYGNILPLTYYAKSAQDSYFAQGFYYIWFYCRVHLFSCSIFLLSTIFLILRSRVRVGSREHSPAGSPFWAAFTATQIYLIFFVARVGGDFMFARFIIPIVPFMCLIIGYGYCELIGNGLWKEVAIASVILLAVFTEEKMQYPPYFTMDKVGHRMEDWNRVVLEGATHWIADERWFYYDNQLLSNLPLGTMELYSEIGNYLKPIFNGLNVKVAIPGAMNMIAYYADFTTAINEYGLTDSTIAHSFLKSRGHIGHEKFASLEYLQEQHVDFELGKVVSQLPKHLDMTQIAFQVPALGVWQLARLVSYDKQKMNELYQRLSSIGNDSRIPLFEYVIPEYVKKVLPQRSLSALEEDYEGFRTYYFKRYPDSGLEQAFLDRIAELKRDSIQRSSSH